MTRTYLQCLCTNAGVLVDASGQRVIVNTAGSDVASVQYVGTLSTGVLKAQYSNNTDGGWTNYTSGATLNSGTLFTDLLAVKGEYLCVAATTGEAVLVDVYIHLRPSNIGSVVST